jgi:hypothetical protein
MDTLTLSVDGEDLLGLKALLKLNETEGDAGPKTVETLAGTLMKSGIANRLRAASLPWAPTPEQVDDHIRARQADVHTGETTGTGSDSAVALRETSVPATKIGRLLANSRLRQIGLSALITAAVVALLGGYISKWSWTGFADNDQVWDWLHLLLLPVALGTFPIWLRYAEHMSRTRTLVLCSLVLAFGGFVAVGYLVPLGWTGFSGNKLWDWLTLIVLPVTVVTIKAWPTSPREIHRGHVTVFGVIFAGWIVTVIGGYAASWSWTGYQGNTLWDWLELLLAPLTLSTILVPAASRWLTGDAARRANELASERAREASIASTTGTASASTASASART